jgi:PEP-CTERM motif
MIKSVASLVLALSTMIPAAASAATFIVQANANSVAGGTALSTISLAAGQAFTVSSSTNDLWSAGPLPRYSDANGLIANRFATALDDSGQPVGTLIGQNFGTTTQNGFTAPFGAMVGRIGTTYFVVGSGFAGVAPTAGVLDLFYWDSNAGDNFGDIRVDVNAVGGAVPEPTTWAMLIAGFGIVGGLMRRQRSRLRAVLS